MIELLGNISKYFLGWIIIGYLFFLIPYFLTNNIRIQYDENIIAIVLILIYITIMLIISLIVFTYLIDRVLKLKNGEAEKADILEKYGIDLIVLFSAIFSLPMILLPVVSLLPSNFISIAIPALFISCYGISWVGLLYLRKKHFIAFRKIALIIQIVFISINIIGLALLLEINIIALPILLFIELLVIHYFCRIGCEEKNANKWKLSILDFYIKNRDKFIHYEVFEYKIFKKIDNIYQIVTIILIVFLLFDWMNKSNFSIKFTEGALRYLNIGAFDGEFSIKKDVVGLIEMNTTKKSEEYLNMKAHIIWSSDKYLFFRDDHNQTISIKKDDMPIDVRKVHLN